LELPQFEEGMEIKCDNTAKIFLLLKRAIAYTSKS